MAGLKKASVVRRNFLKVTAFAAAALVAPLHTASAQQAGAVRSATAAEREVWQMELKLVEFSNAGDIEGFLGLFHEDYEDGRATIHSRAQKRTGERPSQYFSAMAGWLMPS